MSFIKLDRKIANWGWISDPSVLVLWIHILIKANFKPNVWQGMEVGEGELITSVARLSLETGLSTQQVRTALKKLTSTNKYTLIHVNKWSEYQVNSNQSTSEETSRATTVATRRATTLKESKEGKEGKDKENTKEKIRPSLDDVIAYCRERRNGVDPQKWFDYYSANGWKVGKNPMKDWKACVRTWERNNPKPQEEPARRYEQPW